MVKAQELIKKRWVQAALVGLGVCILFTGFTYSKFNGIRHKGVDLETQLSAQYSDNQNELSAFISKFHEQVGIADRKAQQLDTVLTDAIKGRYDNAGLVPATPGSGVQGNQLISALVEAYPDLSGLNSYDRILDTISAGREAYKNKQSVLLDKLRAYDKWRNQDILGSFLINLAGFPSDNLKARIGTDVKTGKEAEDRMYQIVLAGDAINAYQTGQLDPLSADPLPTSSSGK